MNGLIAWVAFAVAAGPFAICLGVSWASNARTREDAAYDRQCSASFGAVLPAEVEQ